MKKMLLRELLNKKVQTLGIILITVLWVSVASFSLNIYSANSDFKETYFNNTNVEDFNFLPDLGQAANIDQLAEKYRFSYEMQGTADFNENGTRYRVISITDKIDTPYILKGALAKASDEIMVNPEYADANHISIGDPLSINGKEFLVSAIATAPNYIKMHVNDTDLSYSKENDALIFIDQKQLDSFDEKAQNEYLAVFHTELTPDEQDKMLQNMVLSNEFINVTPRSDNSFISVYNGKISIFKTLTILSAGMLSNISAILIILFIFVNIRESKKNVGILLANGMKRSKIFTEYWFITLVLILPAAIIGYVIGSIIAPVINSNLQTDISLPAVPFSFHYRYLIIFAILNLYVSLIASFLGTLGILLKSVMTLLKNTKSKKITKFEKVVLRIIRPKNIAGKLKLSFAVRSKLIVFLVFFSIFAAGVEFFLTNVIYNLPHNLKNVQSESINYNQEIYLAKAYDKLSIDGQYFYQLKGVADLGKREEISTIYAMEDGDLLKLADNGAIADGEAVINSTVAELMKLRAGDKFTLNLYDKSVSLKVGAVSKRAIGKEIFVNHDYLVNQNIIEPKYNGLFTKNEINKEDYPEIYSIVNKNDVFKSLEESQRTMESGALILFILGILLPVAIIIVVASFLISNNKSEIEIFKANGIEKKTMNKLIYNSYNSFIVIGLLISIPYAYFILKIILSISVKASGICYPVIFDAFTLLFGIILTCVVYFATLFGFKNLRSAV